MTVEGGRSLEPLVKGCELRDRGFDLTAESTGLK